MNINHVLGHVLFASKKQTIKEVLLEATKNDANLHGANLRGADLYDANLRGADLRGADLYDANLRGADLYDANLRGANLRGADLYDANLHGADLRGANLRGARDVLKAKGIEQTVVLPEGDLIGWKKCRGNIIVKLLIPSGAHRSSATGRKCRASYVKVLEVIGAKEAISHHDGKTTYKKGKTVKCDKWDPDRWNECSGGIHFFITRKEAEDY